MPAIGSTPQKIEHYYTLAYCVCAYAYDDLSYHCRPTKYRLPKYMWGMRDREH